MDFRTEIFSLLVTCLGYIINRIIYGPAKLKSGYGEHEHHYRIPIVENDNIKDVVCVDTVAISFKIQGGVQPMM